MLTRRLLCALACLCLAAGFARTATVPRSSPDFTIQMLGGKATPLGQYRGKVVALAFILTYCAHCQKTIGFLSTMQKEYGPRGLQVVGSAVEDIAATNLPDFLKRFNPPFPVGYNERKPVLDYLQHPEMLPLLMPQLVFIDRQGTIRAQYAGDDKFFGDDQQEKNIRAQIESLLKESAADKKHTTTTAHKKAS